MMKVELWTSCILQMKKLRLREVKSHAQDHKDIKWYNQDLNLQIWLWYPLLPTELTGLPYHQPPWPAQ